MDSVRYTNKNIINAGNILGPCFGFRVGFWTPICVLQCRCYDTDFELFEMLFFIEIVFKSFFQW